MTDVDAIKNALENTLNGTVLSLDSIYGIIIVVAIAFLVYKAIKKATSSVMSIIGFILLLEIGHICAFNTSLGVSFPTLQTIFKYDVLTALAQLCVGTKVADVLLYIQAYLNGTMALVVEKVSWLLDSFLRAAHQ